MLCTADGPWWRHLPGRLVQVAGVQYILDSVVEALAANPDRTFTCEECSQ